jgi:hypothetical protein
VTAAAQLGCVVLCTQDDGHVPTQEALEPLVRSRVVSLGCGTEAAIIYLFIYKKFILVFLCDSSMFDMAYVVL